MRPTAVFLIGGVSKQAKLAGETITADDLLTLEAISDRAGVDAHLVMTCEAKATHGKDPSMVEVRAERARMLDAIAHSGADFVVAFGKTPVRALWNKGSLKTSDLRMKRHMLPDVPLPVHVVNSLEEMAFKPGLRNWAGLEVLRAVAGEIPSKFGHYVIQQEMHPHLRRWYELAKQKGSAEVLERLVLEEPYECSCTEEETLRRRSTEISSMASAKSLEGHSDIRWKVPVLWRGGASISSVGSCEERWEQMAAQRLQGRCHGVLSSEEKLAKGHYSSAVSQLQFSQIDSGALSTPIIAVDLETWPGLSPYDANSRIRMVVISHRMGWAQVVQCGPASEVPDWVRDLLQDPFVLKVGSHIRFDVRWLERFGYQVENYFCTEHFEHLLDENAGIRDLKTLVLRYHPTLGDYSAEQRRLVDERTIRDKKGKEIESGWKFIKDEEMYDYAGGDGDGTITVFHAQVKRRDEDGLARAYAAMREYYPAITRLEHAGACVNMAENKALTDRYMAEIARLQAEIRGHLGAGINPRSPAQLIPALQEHVPDINLRKAMFRAQGDENEFSTEAYVLMREAEKNPVIKTILEFRRRIALYNFVKGMPKHVVRIAGRDYVFSSIRGDITTTYRHSSSRPNLQNLPRSVDAETELGLNVKRQYVSRFEGGSIMEFDQSQLELRETGMIAPDDALIRAFASGEDIHTTLAAMMRGVTPAEVTPDMRQKGKTTNFHVLYGGGPFGLSLRLGCDRGVAQRLIDQFNDTFTGFRLWEAEQHRLAMTRLYVESRFGFRRRFQKPADWASPLGRHIKRQAGNAPIQGGASTLTNLGIARVLREWTLRSIPFLTVHDSLVVDVYPGEEEAVRAAVKAGMENPDVAKYGVELVIPLVVDCKGGPSWGELKEVK